MSFSPEIVAAVLHHMNDDHRDDSVLIVRAFGPEGAAGIESATMVSLDERGGDWSFELDGAEATTRIEWPAGTISERPEIRREIVALYDAACERLGLTPRPHA